MIKILMLGSKEYPMGSNKGDDPIPSGGMETYIDDLVPELSRQCKLIIVTRKFSGTERFEKKGNLEIIRVPYLKGKYLRNPSFNFLSFAYSMNLMKTTDAIYSHGIIASFFGYLLSRIYGKPLICRPAGLAYDQYVFPIKQILYLLMKSIYLKCDVVIFHCEGERDNFIRILERPPRRSEIILTGIPVEKFSHKASSTKKDFSIPEKTAVVGFIGRFVEVKGLEYLVRAANLLKERNVKFMLVGDGPQKTQIERLIRTLGLKESFVFSGFTREIPKALASMDIFVISSLSEGLPTSLLEAMAAGKPCVVTDIGLPVKDMETGLVVPPKNPARLAKAMETLVQDKKLRELLGKNAQKFVLENCTQENAAKRHFEVFSTLKP